MEPNTHQTENERNGNPPVDKPKIITDPSLTAETDDLNTDEAVASADLGSESTEADTEIREDDGLNIGQDDIGLNHNEEDDLSLNK